MTQEEKDLLVKDLCARLPYRVMLYCQEKFKVPFLSFGPLPNETPLSLFIRLIDDGWLPYLRPMSSMTEEENDDWRDFLHYLVKSCNEYYPKSEEYLAMSHSTSIDWLNEHHFDYRGLIEKGLALEAPKDMYKKN